MRETLGTYETDRKQIETFKAETEKYFHNIDGMNASEIEQTAREYIVQKLSEWGVDAELLELSVIGSRCRGIEHDGSDLDIVAEYRGDIREDDLFGILHEDGLQIGGIEVDINPIKEAKTGTLASYLTKAQEYMDRELAFSIADRYILIHETDGGYDYRSEERRTYLPNERVMSQSIPPGLIDYEQSSISVAAVTYNVQREEDIRSQGLLDGISWEEYKAANGERVSQPVDENIINMVSKATGIASENIAMVAYEEPLFIDKEGMNIGATDIIQVVLILIILGLLGFVVFRSMRSEKPVEQEEELSVEDLLQSTPSEGDLGNVVLEDMSDTRRMIEKFVDDNPEAVANLLRNWLNEDWG